MKRIAATLLFGLLAGGCASYEPQPAVSPADARQIQRLQYDESPAVAVLAYDAPAAPGHPHLNLNREPREQGAFVGFEGESTTFSYVLWDDRQGYDSPGFGSGGRDNWFERRAISEETKTMTR